MSSLRSEAKARARDLGIPFDGTPAPFNAITDVKGVEVGHTTLICGEGKLIVGVGPVRTGVTAILPRGRQSTNPTFAGWFSLNGNGEMTGTSWIEESGFLGGPVMITNTHSVGTVRDAVIEWQLRHGSKVFVGSNTWSMPIVGETYDGYLNDVNGFHVKKAHVFDALEGARSGPTAEGNVGGGTGNVCYEFKGGIGTASRKLDELGDYVVGVLAQCNQGVRSQLRIAGVPVGLEITENRVWQREVGSIIIVIATDAPLLPHQLKRVARRASLGLARTGSCSGNDSGDIFIALSTSNPEAAKASGTSHLTMLPNDRMNPIFDACVQATEEAIINALIAAEKMVGVEGHTVTAIPHDRLTEVMRKYNRIEDRTTFVRPA
jgi:D-aminopeptidase